MPFVRQTSFRAGELAPAMWGRTDSPKYAHGARGLRNFFVDQHGRAVSRPGTIFLDFAKPTGVAGGVRLIPCIYSDELAYVLEVGDQYIRIWQRGAKLQYGGGDLTVPTPYTAAEVWGLQYAQTGSSMTLTHPNHPPMELKPSSTPGLWTLTALSFAPPAPWWQSLPDGAVTWDPMVVNPGGTSSPFVASADTPLVEWQYSVSAILRSNVTGRTLETSAAWVNYSYNGTDPGTQAALPHWTTRPSPDLLAVSKTRPLTIRRALGPTLPAHAATEWSIVEYVVYKGRAGLMGLAGVTKSLDFVDDGVAPNYQIQPLSGTNPFVWSTYAQALLTPAETAAGLGDMHTDYPAAVAFFQDRRVFGGSPLRATALFFSAVSNYIDFDPHIVQLSGEALTFDLAARRAERVRALMALSRCLAFTDSAVWSIGGGMGEPLDYNNVQAQVEDAVGIAAGTVPLLVDGTALYVRAKGSGIRGLVPVNGAGGNYQPQDLSWWANHLFVGQTVNARGVAWPHSIVDWTYQEDPWGVVWAVREDGAFLSYTHEQQGGAWCRHDTDGFVFSVCAVPEGTEDVVYLAVSRFRNEADDEWDTRGNAIIIEKMASRVPDDTVAGGCATDMSIPTTLALNTTVIPGLGGIEGRTVWVTAQGNAPVGPLVVAGGQIVLPRSFEQNCPGGTQVYIGLPFTPELETLDPPTSEGRARAKTTVSVAFEVDESRGLQAGSDFDHLVDWQQRDVSDGWGPPSAATDLVLIPVSGTWNDRGARAVLRQSLPLQVTVLGITREVDFGGP